MSFRTKVSTLIGAGILLTLILAFSLPSNANANCIYQYNSKGVNTSSNPVFNKVCNVPDGLGNESDFVRIRKDADGNDQNNVSNPAYSIGTINSTCSIGDRFDIWNYVSNDALDSDNPGSGSGSAAATGAYINMSAPLGAVSKQFSFTATVGDTGNLTNTAGPTSTTNMTPAVINCGSRQVQLTLVPGSLAVYSVPYGSWSNISAGASALNTKLSIGSTNSGLASKGSGVVWGGWQYRLVIVYQVKIAPVSMSSSTSPTCNSIQTDNQTVEDVNYSAHGANVTGYSINLYNGSSTSGTLIASSGNIALSSLPYRFSSSDLTAGEHYTLAVTVLAKINGHTKNITSQSCTSTFTTAAASGNPTNTNLAGTGPSTTATISIFAGVTVLGTALYHRVIKRRIVKN